MLLYRSILHLLMHLVLEFFEKADKLFKNSLRRIATIPNFLPPKKILTFKISRKASGFEKKKILWNTPCREIPQDIKLRQTSETRTAMIFKNW